MLYVGHKDIPICVGFYTVSCKLHDKHMIIDSHQLSFFEFSLMLIIFRLQHHSNHFHTFSTYVNLRLRSLPPFLSPFLIIATHIKRWTISLNMFCVCDDGQCGGVLIQICAWGASAYVIRKRATTMPIEKVHRSPVS